MTERKLRVKTGKTVYPKPTPHIATENKVSGPGFKAERTAGASVLRFLRAAHGGGIVELEISDREFDALRDGEITYGELAAKYQNGNGDLA